MTRIGLTLDELLAATWAAERPVRYAAHLPGLDLLEGETVALVGETAAELLEAFLVALPGTLPVDGAVAGSAGAIRIHAQQAARVGVSSIAISDPLGGLTPAARSIAIADLAGLADLGVTTVVATADAGAALLFADRVALVRDGRVEVAYPVTAPRPRVPADVRPVADRMARRLAA